MNELPSRRLLVVDDDPAMGDLLVQTLGRRGFVVDAVRNAADALERLAAQDYEVVLTDMRMPEMSGVELCTRCIETRPGVPVIVLTAFGSMDTAVAAIRAGAYDFITKPCDIDVLALTLERAGRYRQLREDVRLLREQLTRERRFSALIGESEPMRKVRDLMQRVAATDVTVLLTGESGTGKEVVARALHEESRRARGPFVAINCAALPEALLESELFGHVRGAFTDARSKRTGLFVRAHSGTLFLDEIGEMPLSMQAKLLRVLQDRRLRPVGGDEEIGFDVRVIAATNRDLPAAVDEGRFRQDLFFRLNVLEIALPALRARGKDILLLAQHHLERCAAELGKNVVAISAEAARHLLAYTWPGNVRELNNSIERAVALARFDHITPEDLPERLVSHSPDRVVVAAGTPDELVPLEQVERRYIEHVLESVGGRRTEAARILGLDRKTLYRKLERWQRSS